MDEEKTTHSAVGRPAAPQKVVTPPKVAAVPVPAVPADAVVAPRRPQAPKPVVVKGPSVPANAVVAPRVPAAQPAQKPAQKPAAQPAQNNEKGKSEELNTQQEPEVKEKRPFLTIYNIIGLALCLLLLPGFVISTSLLFSSLLHSDIPPNCFGYTPLMVETGSMSPVFDSGDLIIIQNTEKDDAFEVGDIICFHSGNSYVTHRVKELTQSSDGGVAYITQGDANNAPDAGMVLPEQVLGVYCAHYQGMGRAFLFIQSPGGMIVSVVLPIIVLLLLCFVPPMIAARKELKSKKERGTKK